MQYLDNLVQPTKATRVLYNLLWLVPEPLYQSGGPHLYLAVHIVVERCETKPRKLPL